MKKLILAGIIIIICCLVFLIVRQNTSRADIGMDISMKPYPVPFGDWVEVWLNSLLKTQRPDYFVVVVGELIEDKVRFKVVAMYNNKTEAGKIWYDKIFPAMKENIKLKCVLWTKQGYPISLNDFQFDIQEIQ